jgi:hypothetical protein
LTLPRWWRLAALLVVGAIQVAVPLRMIAGQQRTLREGTVWRFRTAPVDPADAFRGRYVALGFENDHTTVAPGHEVSQGDWVYVPLSVDGEGFARLEPALGSPPASGDYLRLRAQWLGGGGEQTLVHFTLPFHRLYLEESAAPRAEAAYVASQRADARRPAWAVVRVLDGRAALEDVRVEGRSLREMARAGG